VRAEVVGVSVPDTPEGVRDLAATNPGDSSPGAQREQQRAKRSFVGIRWQFEKKWRGKSSASGIETITFE
jgi:hypothetical protein